MEYKIIFYPKFYYEFNHFKYVWYNRKSWIREKYKYSIKKLRNDISKVLK